MLNVEGYSFRATDQRIASSRETNANPDLLLLGITIAVIDGDLTIELELLHGLGKEIIQFTRVKR